MNIYNLNYNQFVACVSSIKYGYIDKNKNIYLDCFQNPDKTYYLQFPNELLKSKVGLCYDIVELYRDYLSKKGYDNESYFLMYRDNDILETHSFIIFKKTKNLWFECLDNSWENVFYQKGYYDKDQLIKSIYDWFIEYVESKHTQTRRELFFLSQYKFPYPVLKGKVSLIDYCTNKPYLNTSRLEYSGMAIVFCKKKVLILETKHNEFVFPKGHIEEGETSKDASIRECFEESGVSLSNAKYYGECGQYAYTFSGGHLKICNDDFYKTFQVNSITKSIYVHVYEIDDFQDFNLESIFIHGYWVEIRNVKNIITHDNTKELFSKALKIYNQKKAN